MSFGLLWLEVLAVALLWVAASMSLAARMRRGAVDTMVGAGILLVPCFLIPAALVLVVSLDVFKPWWLGYYTLAGLTASAALIGVVMLRRLKRWRTAREATRPTGAVGLVMGIIYGLVALAVILVPALVLTSAVAMTAVLKYGNRVGPSRFGMALSLWIAFLIGALVLHRMSRRQRDGVRAAEFWPAGRLLLALAVAFAVTVMTLWNMDLAARTQLSGLRAEAGAKMLSVAPPAVADDLNAAVIYERAFERLNADRSWEKNPDHPLNQEKPDYGGTEVREFLAKHAETLALLRRAAQKPECYFVHDYSAAGLDTLLPELQQLRESSNLLSFHARQQLAQSPPAIDAAVDDINAMLRIAEHTARTPFLINALVSYGIDAQALNIIEEAIPHFRSVEQMERIRLPDVEQPRRFMVRSLVAEEAAGMATLCGVVEGGPRAPLIGFLDEYELLPGAVLFRVFFLVDDVGGYRSIMQRYSDLSRRPYHRTRADWEKLSSDLNERKTPHGLLTMALVPAFSTMAQRMAMFQASVEGGRTGLAAAKYRIERGVLPATVKELVPKYLPSEPVDPFDGKEMRYKVVGDEAVVYSVGANLVDDGGAERSWEHGQEKGDVTFHVRARR